MALGASVGVLSHLGARSLGVFRGRAAVELAMTRNQLTALIAAGVIERVLPDTYRMCVVARSNEQLLRAALLWVGHDAAAAGASAGEMYRLEGVRAAQPEIVVPRRVRQRAVGVTVHRSDDRAAQMVRRVGGIPATGIEPTLMALAAALGSEAFEIACEDARRRRRLTSVPSLHSFLARFGGPGRPGAAPLRELLDALDPVHAARSTLEVKTRRLLTVNGINDLAREFPLVWNGRRYRFDFAFPRRRTILETNGRRWHDDSTDYEHDNEKWSVPGRHGYRIVFATWEKVTRDPDHLLAELTATLAA